MAKDLDCSIGINGTPPGDKGFPNEVNDYHRLASERRISIIAVA